MEKIGDLLRTMIINTASQIVLRRRDILNGKWNKEKTVLISFDCDFDSDMIACRRLLPLLDEDRVRCSFAVSGFLVKRFSSIIEEIIKDGHEIINHTFSHPNNFSKLSQTKQKEEVDNFQKLMKEMFDYTPCGFRVPHLLRRYQKDIIVVLEEARLIYDSSILGNGYLKLSNIIELLLTTCPEHPRRAFDSYHHFHLPSWASRESFFRGFTKLLDMYNFVNIYLDPRDVVSALTPKWFRKMIFLSKKRGFCIRPLYEICKEI